MKRAAMGLLVAGIAAVVASFLWPSPTALPSRSPDEAQQVASDAELAHNELLEPTEEQLRRREAAQERVLAEAEAMERRIAWRTRVQRGMRFGGCLLAAVGIAILWIARHHV